MSLPSKDLIGTVVRAHITPRTVHVSVPYQKMHSVTRKMLTYHHTYLVHDADSICQLGNVVRIVPHPVTTKKQHTVAEKLAQRAPNYITSLSTPWYQAKPAHVRAILESKNSKAPYPNLPVPEIKKPWYRRRRD